MTAIQLLHTPPEEPERTVVLAPSSSSGWYKDAVIYEVHVRAFHDGNGDGVGDFRGLIEKLDYLQELGVTALWLLPFYPSPLRDDGYDISDYRQVHPSYGTLRDFRLFLREAHRRGIRVITELVLAHTSDEHPWFQRARRAKPGSVHRDFYVWSDTPDRFSEARIIFKDFETSNWSFDPSPRPTSGTASTPTSRASTTTTRRCARPCSTWWTSGCRWASTASASMPCPTCMPARARRAENLAGDVRFSPPTARPRRQALRRPDAAGRGQPVARGCGARTWAMATCATWPSTSRSCPACSWRPGRRTGSPWWTFWPRRRPLRPTASGPCSCATTTS